MQIIPLIGAAAIGLALALPAQAETSVTYATWLTPNHPTNVALSEYFEDLKSKTGGTLVFEPHFAGSLLGAKAIPSGVRDGIADSGYFIGAYVPSELPIDGFLSRFSLLNDDPLALTGAINELILVKCPECRKEYGDGFQTKYLATIALTPYVFHCKEKLVSTADFEGRKIRGISGWSEMIEGLGAVPVKTSSGEMYEALERGILDCAIHTISNQRIRSLNEVAPYVIDHPFGGFVGGSVLNMHVDKWDDLSEEQRTVIVDGLPKAVAGIVFGHQRLDAEVREEMSGKGTEFYAPDPELAAYIAEARNTFSESAYAIGEQRSIENSREIADQLISLRAEWIALLDANGRDRETFERLLAERVFSKMPAD